MAIARVQHDPAPSLSMGIDQVVDAGLDSGMGERLHHNVALPGAIALGLPMLRGAAAAGSKMRTERRNAFRARHDDA